MSLARFDALSEGLARGVLERDGLFGLVLLGSASAQAAGRRDEWSDHDFFALIEPGRGAEVRPDLSWLPERERLVLTAREGEIGFVAVYDDGHVFEFALAETDELVGAVAGDATVVLDDDGSSVATLIAGARERAAASDLFDPGNDTRLVLVKLLIGVGRVRRGEVLGGGEFIRQWAVKHLVRALRGRHSDRSTIQRDAIDPVRRFEKDFPEAAARISSALAQEPEAAARALFGITRDVLEPGWDDFPTAAADAVADRLGWPRHP